MKEVLLLSLALLCGAAAKTLFLKSGDKCKDGEEPWFCQESSSCKALKKQEQTNPLDICSFEGFNTIVCCPPNSPNQNGSSNNSQSSAYKSKDVNNVTEPPSYGKKAKEKCKEYAEYVYSYIEPPILVRSAKKKKVAECAISAETLIVGGKPAKLNEFPHMALIGLENSDSEIEWFCGGSLISSRFILTAAHCNISQHIGSVVVRLGELDVKDDRDQATPIDLKVVEVFDHPDYNHSIVYHDISLLKLEKEVELGPSIRPLCLHTSRSISNNKAIASGWGHTSFGGYESSNLLKVELDLLSDDKCKDAYEFERSALSHGLTPETIFCAGGKEGKDACQGDSGGPLQTVLQEPYCMYSQIGVTSFGIGCGFGTPGGFTRVSHYIPWIESIVWP